MATPFEKCICFIARNHFARPIVGILFTLILISGFSSCTQTVYLPSTAYQPCVDTTDRFDAEAGGTLFRGGVYGRLAYAITNNIAVQGSYTFHKGGYVMDAGPTGIIRFGVFPEDWGNLSMNIHVGYVNQKFSRNMTQYFADRGRRVSEDFFHKEYGASIFSQQARCNYWGFCIQPGLQYRTSDGDLVVDLGLRTTNCFTSSFLLETTDIWYDQPNPDPSLPVEEHQSTTLTPKPPEQVWMAEPFVSISGPFTSLIYGKFLVQYRCKMNGWAWVHMGRYDVTMPLYFDFAIGIHL